jgi:hypothetical protein
VAGMGIGREEDFACCSPSEEVTPLYEGIKASAMGTSNAGEIKFWPPLEGEGLRMDQENRIMNMMEAGSSISTGMNPRPISNSATEQNFMALTKNIDDLFNAVVELEQRIAPILLPDGPESRGDERRGYAGPTGVSERLGGLCHRTDDLRDRLNYLTQRIDL